MKVPTLMYHEIDDNYSSSRYVLGKDKFEWQIRYLYENRFKTITADELYIKRSFGREIIITFDDGLKNAVKYALPLLKRYNFKAHLFISPGLVGKSGYLDWDEIKGLGEEFIFGFHGLNHLPLTGLNDADLFREVSKEKLESRLKRKIDCISIPHGAYDKRIEMALRSAGYKYVFTSDPFPNTEKSNPFYLGRFAILRNISFCKYARLVKNHRIQLLWEKLFYGIKEKVKKWKK